MPLGLRPIGSGALGQGPLRFLQEGVQPQPEPEVVVRSGGRPERPLPPRIVRKPIIAEIHSGQGRQTVSALFRFNLVFAARSIQMPHHADARIEMSVDAVGQSTQSQISKAHFWPSMRATMRAAQVSQVSVGQGRCSLDIKIASGVIPQQSPSYSGKPLPRIFMD